MSAKPFILVTTGAAAIAMLSACTCNGCTTELDESLATDLNVTETDTGDTSGDDTSDTSDTAAER